MELLQVNEETHTELKICVKNSDKAFIEANTLPISLAQIRNDHIIPVFIKDNEPLISHSDFIDSVSEVVNSCFGGETTLEPNIRLSHAIKGRVPSAKDKPAKDLLEHEKTIYYERMGFVIEIPSFNSEIDGSILTLMIGGIKSYALDNFYNKIGADQHFKLFIGFKNTICTNLCIWTDGFKADIKASSVGIVKACTRTMIENYNQSVHLFNMKQLVDYTLTEQQVAILIGRLRMYQHLPKEFQGNIDPLYLGDNQINAVVKDFFKSNSFCRDKNGNINLWRFYNLLTGANKSSYIDSFIDRSVNAYHFIEKLRYGLEDKSYNWYLS